MLFLLIPPILGSRSHTFLFQISDILIRLYGYGWNKSNFIRLAEPRTQDSRLSRTCQRTYNWSCRSRTKGSENSVKKSLPHSVLMKPHNRRFLEDIDASPAPVTSIRLSTANNLNDNLSSLTETNDRTPSGQPNSSIDSTSFAFGGVLLLIAVCFVVFLSIYIYCLADDNPPDGIRRRRHQTLRGSCFGIDPKIIESLPLFACDSNVKELSDCPICLSEFEEKELVKMIPFCGHFFHPQCIDMWLSAQGSCPLCRSTQLFRSLPSPPPQLKVVCDGGSSRDIPPLSSMESDAQQRQVFRPAPTPSSSALVTRVNSFSSSTSSSSVGDRDGVCSLQRSTSF